ncbi:hypothetical protein [Alkalihalobacterium bogoriense]|uniref:hypothetical protein n=1 Tax=Alkalihalobacterium bogoriense TaxID=246272 RepID=UPI00047DC796|nr:hypothetical protein [Alkalihalobacterium bogoriense]
MKTKWFMFVCFLFIIVGCTQKMEATFAPIHYVKTGVLKDDVIAISQTLPGNQIYKSFDIGKDTISIHYHTALMESERFLLKKDDEISEKIILNNALSYLILLDSIDTIKIKVIDRENSGTLELKRSEAEQLVNRPLVEYSNDEQTWRDEIIDPVVNEDRIRERWIERFYTQP